MPVQAYLRLAHEGKYREALAMIKTENPFPAVCGRVCNKRCESECTRGKIDAPVSIDAVKKFVADLDLNAEDRFVPEKTALHSLKTHEWIEKNCSIVHYNGKYKPWKEGYIGTLAYLWHREEESLLDDAQREP